MSERNPNEKFPFELLKAAVQDPERFGERHISKGVRWILTALITFRTDLRNAPTSVEIENPDVDFKTFYENGNGTLDFYVALTRMLQRIGFDKIEVEGAFESVLPDQGGDALQNHHR